MKHLLFALFALFVVCSCATSHTTEIRGKTTVFVNDTTIIYHGGNTTLKFKTPVH